MVLLEDSIVFAKEKLQHFDAGHDWSHAERVLNLARKIRELEGDGDLQVIELSAVLHDIADTKFHAGTDEDGGNMAHEFLLKKGFDPEKASLVKHIINNISFKRHFDQELNPPVEFQIVQDADRLDAMGAIGIARAFNYGGFKNRSMYEPGIPPMEYKNSESYKNSAAPTINHFYEKLFKLKDLMHTRSGKRMAEERHQYMVQFVDRFLEEWEGLK